MAAVIKRLIKWLKPEKITAIFDVILSGNKKTTSRCIKTSIKMVKKLFQM